MKTEKHKVKVSLENAAESIAMLESGSDEQRYWIAYFLECLETFSAEAGEATLENVQEVLMAHLENGGW